MMDMGLQKSVVNLSVSDTEPSVEYRNRFYEFGLRREPARIVVFLYAANDYRYGYRYEPYEHPKLFVTLGTLSKALTISPRAAMTLGRFYVEGRPITSWQDIADAMPGVTDELVDLTYLSSLAYGSELSTAGAASSSVGRLMKSAGGRLARVLGEVTVFGQVALPPEPNSETCLATEWTTLWPDYQKVFEAPRISTHSRLDEIGEFVARRYCGFDDPKPFVDLLRAQSAEFRDYVTWGADMPYFLFPSMAGAVSGEEKNPGLDLARAEQLALEYAKLVFELDEAARSQGSLFTVVLIPEDDRKH